MISTIISYFVIGVILIGVASVVLITIPYVIIIMFRDGNWLFGIVMIVLELALLCTLSLPVLRYFNL